MLNSLFSEHDFPTDMTRTNKHTYGLHHFCFLLAIVFYLFSPINGSLAETGNEVKVGVLAKRGKEKAIQQWGPTVDYLSGMMENTVFRLVPLDFDEIYPAIEHGKIDFVLTNSAYYIRLEYEYGVERITTLKNKRANRTMTHFGGVLFCRKDRTDIQQYADLKNKHFMAVDERSFGGWMAGWYHLLLQGIRPDRDFSSLEFGGTHDAVVYAVRDAKVDVGTVRTDTLERMALEGKIKLDDFKVLGDHSKESGFPFFLSTELYPEWPMAKLKHVDRALAERVTIALLQLSPEHPAAKAASISGWTIAHAYQPVRNCLKTLRVAPYEQFGIITWQEALRQHWLQFVGFSLLLITTVVVMIVVLTLNRQLKNTTISLDQELAAKKIMENRLQQFKFTLDQTLDCVFMIDPDSLQFIYANQGALNKIGYSMEELSDMTLLDINRNFTPQQYHNLLAPLLRGQKQSIFYTTLHRTKDGQDYPVEIFLQYITLDDGAHRFLAIVRDISKRLAEEQKKEQLQSQLFHAQKLESVGQLAAGIAHEINTPTQFIGTNIDFMDEATEDISSFMREIQKIAENAPQEIGDQIRAALDEADWEYLSEELPQAISQSQEGVKRVSTIVLAMKEFSHPGSREKVFQNLNHIIETTITVASNEWKYVADMEMNLDPDLPDIPLLADEMGQVILNMLVNSAHAIGEKLGANPEGEKGLISISTKKLTNSVELRIRDTGLGIPEKARPRIFDPFYTTKEVGKGSGQGLAISHDVIVGKHGGSVDFVTETGKGTEFIIQLPLRDETPITDNEVQA